MKAQNGRRNRRRNKGTNPPKSAGRMVRAPVAQNQSSRRAGVQYQRHSECERVASISGSVAFASSGDFALNPGLDSSFPWLSGVAQHYERYSLERFIVRYKNLKGTGTDGNIIMSWDPDTLDVGPTTAVIQTQSTVYADGAPWRVFEMHVPCDRKKRFIRTGAVAGADLKTYDMGRIWVSAEGCADTSTHGYLEFEYTVILHEKQTTQPAAAQCISLAQFNLSSNQALTTATAATVVFDEEVLNNTGITNSSGVFTLPAGTWEVNAEVSLGGGTAASITKTLEIQADSASLTPPVYGHEALSATVTAWTSPVCATAIVTSDGTTTVRARVTYTSSSGTLVARGDETRITLRIC